MNNDRFISVRVDSDPAKEAFRRSPERMRKLVGNAVWRGALEVARTGRQLAPKAFSILVNSINATRITDLHAYVAPGVNYAADVEEGRKPGKQPGTANGLTEWVKQKTGLQGKALDQTTYIIARAIGRRGIRPQPYMRPAAESNESRVITLVRDAVDRGCAESFA